MTEALVMKEAKYKDKLRKAALLKWKTKWLCHFSVGVVKLVNEVFDNEWDSPPRKTHNKDLCDVLT